jgi:hypothetical protein
MKKPLSMIGVWRGRQERCLRNSIIIDLIVSEVKADF